MKAWWLLSASWILFNTAFLMLGWSLMDIALLNVLLCSALTLAAGAVMLGELMDKNT